MGIINLIDKDGFKVNMEEFYSCKDVVETNNKRYKIGGGFDRSDIEDEDWYGVESWNDIENFMIYGYTETIDEFKKKLNQNIQNQEDKRISFKNDVLGFAPIIPLAIQGIPNSMINTDLKRIKSKCLKVIYNVNYGAMASADEIKDNGKKLLSALIKLELQGYRIELSVAYICGCDYKGYDCLNIRVKETNQPFSLQRMMYPIVHPSMFRTIGFDWETRFDKAILKHAGNGHSPVYDYSGDKLKRFVNVVFGKNAIMFCGRDLAKNGEDYIIEVIKNEINKNK